MKKHTFRKGACFMKKEVPQGKYAWSVKIGEKGQFVIPKEAREIFGIHPGDTVLLVGDVNRGLAIPSKETQDRIIGIAMGDGTFREEENK